MLHHLPLVFFPKKTHTGRYNLALSTDLKDVSPLKCIQNIVQKTDFFLLLHVKVRTDVFYHFFPTHELLSVNRIELK